MRDVVRCYLFYRWEQALAALLRTLSVPDMPMQVQLERSIEAAVLCEGMGLKVRDPSDVCVKRKRTIPKVGHECKKEKQKLSRYTRMQLHKYVVA